MNVYDLLELGKAYLIFLFAANIIVSVVTLYHSISQREWMLAYIIGLFAVPIGIFAFLWSWSIKI